MVYNRAPFTDPQSIRHAHGLIGFAGTDGAIEDLTLVFAGGHFKAGKKHFPERVVMNLGVLVASG